MSYGIIIEDNNPKAATMIRKILILLFLFTAFQQLSAQGLYGIDTLNVARLTIVDGDTFYVARIEEVYIFPKNRFKNKWEERRYRRLIRNVKKAYPYAVIANQMLYEINENAKKLKTEKARKEYIKQVEKEIRAEFEEELKGLTVTQGRILIKLIDRQTGDTSYELVKELRGTFSAVFWQALARVFGSNLKSEFDPFGEDKLINEIVIMIENGQI